MKKFLIKYQEALLVIMVLAFLGIFIYFFDLTISELAYDLNQTIQPATNPSASAIQFNFSGFQALKLKGQ
ncbi:hypothetical protein M1513_00190 [Patescibacteria group bacterium]|nr:hypothetical protein [Patescibacteria group bacterium]MCL5733560.1 hypothetical protein [Patescibacteria group bacterium]